MGANLCPILKLTLTKNDEEDEPYPDSIENLRVFWDSPAASDNLFKHGCSYAILASFKDHKVTDDFIETIREGIFGQGGDSEMRDQSK